MVGLRSSSGPRLAALAVRPVAATATASRAAAAAAAVGAPLVLVDGSAASQPEATAAWFDAHRIDRLTAPRQSHRRPKRPSRPSSRSPPPNRNRSRAHHELWTGATDATGKGQVRIDGKLRSVQRAAWEFAHGPLLPHQRVLACPAHKTCVAVAHLQLDQAQPKPSERVRRQRGSGSMRELRPRVWELAITEPERAEGRSRRRTSRFNGTEAEAAERLADLAEATRLPTRLGDQRVRELLHRYLDWVCTSAHDYPELRRVAEDIIEPTIGREFAAVLETSTIERVLHSMEARGTAADRDLVAKLLDDAYRWLAGVTGPDATRHRTCGTESFGYHNAGRSSGADPTAATDTAAFVAIAPNAHPVLG